METHWKLAGAELNSRLLLGTAHFSSWSCLQQAVLASETNVITLSLRRSAPQQQGGKSFWAMIKTLPCHVLPNTAGCRKASEAVEIAYMARELFATSWIKLEVFGDDYNLQPDPFELLKAAKILNKEGFEVFPYCTEDLVLCQRLVDCGCKILMPWGSPIGTGKGLLNPYALEVLRARLPKIILVVDAGIGKPSHVVQAMELGFDAVLVNTAVALAHDPIQMAVAFRDAVKAGRTGFLAGLMNERNLAHPSTPLVDTPFWLQEVK